MTTLAIEYTQIHSTMTDRATTETKFNNILQAFRAECLPLHKDNWNSFSEEVQSKLIDLHQFFCGLHLMVGMADTVNATMRSIEGMIHVDADESEMEEEMDTNRVEGESVIVRCVRTIVRPLKRCGREKWPP